MNRLLLFATLLLTTGCQEEADIRPSSYDELAMATGHWEWDSWQNGFSGTRTPASVGFTQQLTFGAGGQLTIRRNGELLHQESYQLSVGTFTRCGQQYTQVPLLTFANRLPLPNDEAKTYDLIHQGNQMTLKLIGRETRVDYGAFETYHWVAE
ncbi:hypothetical protein GCM10027422_04640 [Hymenobacter arcticus]